MKERTIFVVKTLLVVIFAIVVTLGIYSFKRNTQISPVGGTRPITAVQISRHNTIKINVFIEKDDRWPGIYAYWDNNKNNKHKLKKGLFAAKGEIEVPDELGLHKLTIEKGTFKIKYNYYYEITEELE